MTTFICDTETHYTITISIWQSNYYYHYYSNYPYFFKYASPIKRLNTDTLIYITRLRITVTHRISTQGTLFTIFRTHPEVLAATQPVVLLLALDGVPEFPQNNLVLLVVFLLPGQRLVEGPLVCAVEGRSRPFPLEDLVVLQRGGWFLLMLFSDEIDLSLYIIR